MRVLIAGGGTGGHLYPGIAVAEEIYRQDRNSDVLFVGTQQGIEARILPKEGYKLETIPAGGIANKRIGAKLVSGVKMIRGFVKAMSILRRFNPDVVIGVGGYASVPMLSAAAILRFPTIIMEQNLLPGLANRMLSLMVKKVVVAFDGSKRYFKRNVEVLGNPVRRGIAGCPRKKTDEFVIFVFGGSQGARTINKAVAESLEYLKKEASGIRFIHQTGEKDFEWVKDSYKKAGIPAEVKPYVYNMEDAYNRADIVISRAGATSIAEISACGRPAILIPYPFAAHDHQKLNAEYLKSMGTAEVISESDITGKIIAEKITYFLYNRDRLKEMSEKSAGIYRKTAASDIVKLCLELAATR
ncbi:MAG: undecaprenyldiphospho-muramoylpentapeptide beta-N-acetylglucosaminyltransferase [Nitrospira sp.]|nr:undecaprenyldiphospho-muramoylpentapeptide beta-N-acetylglucosaminyltransferase [Nitrospira sp.]